MIFESSKSILKRDLKFGSLWNRFRLTNADDVTVNGINRHLKSIVNGISREIISIGQQLKQVDLHQIKPTKKNFFHSKYFSSAYKTLHSPKKLSAVNIKLLKLFKCISLKPETHH